ncbi:S8 family serine peptidase [Gloeobacter morelensis]|uniref:S8 family serine peptidase n=1 Tax=Gloeobacter morelensis MG652769 TaxID=2781736 RepID=A0ABY3PGU8_9CYAN|nr:S8 family serine peptidase [Gloeobacter morelensis]UFP92870.1 S8 family serine peptidase [Gloeobacter morelensis MG652769]
MHLRRWWTALWAGMALALAGGSAVLAEPLTPPQEAVIAFRDPVSRAFLNVLQVRHGLRFEANSRYSSDGRVFRVRYAPDKSAEVKALLSRLVDIDMAEYAEPNYVYRTLGFPNDPLYPQQWNLRAIGIEGAWQKADGSGAVVAVIDTGVARRLPDMAQTDFVRGYDFVNDDDDATDDQGHGSHVAGTIAQSTDNGEGVAGIAYRARIMPVKVLDRYGSGSALDVAEGIKFAADNGANVINLSLGGPGDSSVLREAVDYAHRKGVVVVCAAGNESAPQASYPALYANCLSVSATGPDGSLSFFSNFGRGVDLSAPGGDKSALGADGGILQNTIDEQGNSTYASYQGTSMAAPHVAGVAALVYSAGVQDAAEIRKVLLSATRPVGHDFQNQHGAGQLNAQLALDSLENPYWFFRGGFWWLVPLATLAVGILLGTLVMLGSRAAGFSEFFYTVGFAATGLGFFPLSAFGTLWGPEGLLALLATPIPNWDLRFFEGWLNPGLHTVLVPGLFAALFSGSGWGRSLAVGACVGTAALLALQGSVFYTPLMWFTEESYARGFLLVNALLSLFLGFFIHRSGGANP